MKELLLAALSLSFICSSVVYAEGEDKKAEEAVVVAEETKAA